MKNKKMLSLALLSMLVAIGAFLSNRKNYTNLDKSSLLLCNAEALSFDSEEWWNRKDYDCVAVTYQCLLGKYPSNVADYVGEGKGSVAHSWNCTGCGNCGYTVNK